MVIHHKIYKKNRRKNWSYISTETELKNTGSATGNINEIPTLINLEASVVNTDNVKTTAKEKALILVQAH